MDKPIDMCTMMMDYLAMSDHIHNPVTELEKLLQVHSAGHFVDFPEHRAARKHSSDWLVIWVLAGKGFIKEQDKCAEVASGHLISFELGKSHAYGSETDQPWEIMWVHFGGSMARQFHRAIRQFGDPVALLGLDTQLRDQFDDLMAASMGLQHVHEDTPGNRDILTGQMLAALLGRMVHLLKHNQQQSTGHEPDQLDVTLVRRDLHRHLTEPLTLEQLAAGHHLSVTHFSRLFRKHFSTSPMHYIIQQRMARAASLLVETSAPIKQISDNVGYEDAYYFSRLFKRITGLTPSDYRKQHRQISASE